MNWGDPRQDVVLQATPAGNVLRRDGSLWLVSVPRGCGHKNLVDLRHATRLGSWAMDPNIPLCPMCESETTEAVARVGATVKPDNTDEEQYDDIGLQSVRGH